MKKLDEKSIFRNRNFVLLWLGQLVSLLGNRFHEVASMWYIYQVTGSPLKMGITLVFSTLPAVILGPFAGAVADRYDRKKIIVLSDFINGGIVGVITILMYMGNLEIWMLYLLAGLRSAASTFFGPAVSAITPSIVQKEQLLKANSMNQLSRDFTGILGYAAGGAMIAIMGISGLFLFDSISFTLSAISETFINVPKVRKEAVEKKCMRSEILESIYFIIKKKELLHFVIVGGLVINFFLAPLEIYITLFAGHRLNMDSGGFGILLAAITVGSICMTLLMPAIGRRLGYYTLTFIGLTLEGLLMMLFGVSGSFYTSLVILALMGASICICNVSLSTIFQNLIPNEMMGRVGGILGTICQATIPLGYFIGGMVTEKFDLTAVLVTSGLIVALSGLSTFRIARASEPYLKSSL
ncbi:MAG TPA: MFS transporter [Clostridia bacterium]|nr:MFS transporter [Clostridia bacterium]